MILFERTRLDAQATHARQAVLEAMRVRMKVHAYQSVDALATTLRGVVDEMARHRAGGWDMPNGLTMVVLVFTDPAALNVVAALLARDAAVTLMACPQPAGWQGFYAQIDRLRAEALAADPDFTPRYR